HPTPAPGLKPLLPHPFATPAAMVARMVQQAAVPELAASATSTPAAAKRQAPKRVAPIAAIATTEPAPPQAATDSISVAQYRQQLITTALRYKRYPPAAVDNEWQGDVIVRLSVAASGTIAGVSLARSSGYGPLDEQALAMFRNAAAEAPVPQGLRGQEFAIEVRAVYNLKDQ